MDIRSYGLADKVVLEEMHSGVNIAGLELLFNWTRQHP